MNTIGSHAFNILGYEFPTCSFHYGVDMTHWGFGPNASILGFKLILSEKVRNLSYRPSLFLCLLHEYHNRPQCQSYSNLQMSDYEWRVIVIALTRAGLR